MKIGEVLMKKLNVSNSIYCKKNESINGEQREATSLHMQRLDLAMLALVDASS